MKLIIHIIFITYLFSQTSSLSMYGMGEYVHSFDASSIALGDSKYFNGYDNRINYSSPSSYWKSSLSNLMMSISTNVNEFASKDLLENNFRMFSFTFPINENRICAFGMNPVVRSEFSISEMNYTTVGANESPTGQALAFNTDYSFNGGISEFFILISSKISNNISFGIRWSKLFGTSENKYYLNLYDMLTQPDLDGDPNPSYTFSSTDSFIDKNKYSSDKYLLEFRFEYDKISTVLSYGRSTLLDIDHTPYYCGGLSDSDCENYYNIYNNLISTENYNSINKLKELGFGLKYIINNQLGMVFEYNSLDTFNSYEFVNIFKSENPNVESHHLGVYYIFNNDINAIINQSILKFGLFNRLNKFNSMDIYDRGLTFGYGFNYFDNKNFVDISFKFGSKTTQYSEFENERYYSVILTISGGEKWFINERKNK